MSTAVLRQPFKTRKPSWKISPEIDSKRNMGDPVFVVRDDAEREIRIVVREAFQRTEIDGAIDYPPAAVDQYPIDDVLRDHRCIVEFLLHTGTHCIEVEARGRKTFSATLRESRDPYTVLLRKVEEEGAPLMDVYHYTPSKEQDGETEESTPSNALNASLPAFAEGCIRQFAEKIEELLLKVDKKISQLDPSRQTKSSSLQSES